jgi:5-methylcytosine-specific restriction endonuclease McrA
MQPDPHAPPPTQIVVHADADLRLGADDTGTVLLSTEAVRRLSCDALVRRVRDGVDGALDGGRARRTLTRKQRRALVRRDGDQCRFPGCTSRHYLHAHHIWHWTDGGPTDLANLVLLCPFHHKLVHEGGWQVDGDANEELTFVGPDGKRLAESIRRRLRAHWRSIPFRQRNIAGDVIRTATGERLDLDLAITALCCLAPPDRN